MKEDIDFIRQLEKVIGSEFKKAEFDELLESKQNGYTIDEQGAVTGLCLFKVSLNSLVDTALPFKNLRQLVLSGVDVKMRDFSHLRQMTSLTLLDLSSNGIDDISFLSGLKHIDQLYLGSNHIADISPLENLVHLTTLDLQKNQLASIGSLETLDSLKIVNLQDNKVPDISPLQRLSRIVYLNITGSNISDIFPLQGMSKLAYLDAANNQIENISILSRFPGLSYLNLAGNKITDISAIRGLTGLTVLKLAKNNINSIFSLIELKDLTSLDLEKNKISDLTALSGLTNLVELRLGVNQITDLTPLSALTKLTELNINENEITDLTPLSAITNLTKLWLNSNQITDFTPLSALTKLNKIELSVNQITDLTPLSALTNLKELNLNTNKITDLTPLSALKKLTRLDLERNQITDLTPLRSLTNLKNLRLGNNQIEDITPLTTLTHLEELVLYWNQISDISPLSDLIKINDLSLSSNNIIDLSPLNPLTSLTNLWLNKNNIDDLTLTPLRALTQLVKLGLRINRINDITSIKELTNLKGLDVSRNNITKLPPDIDSWWSSMEINWVDKPTNEGLNLYGNPLTDPPEEIVRKGIAAVKNYFGEIEKGSVLFLESKLLLVGSGDVGKTTLMKKLKDKNFVVVPGREDTTRGIDIQPWQLSCPFDDGLSRDVKIHFWDFGGQDILHATHQFFLTKRSLYLFVWDPRKEEETRSFDYWLNAVKLFGAGSPLIMVMNKADMRIKHIDEESFQDKFPNIAQFLQVSCVSGLHIPDLTDAIRTTLSGMPHLLDKLPKRWMEIRDELKARQDNYITLDDYFAICLSHQMEKEKALFLSGYLHDLGIILHFHQDPLLEETVILKPEWATGAVYALIDSLEIQNNNGRFKRAHLDRYWNPEIYPAEKYGLLLYLIEKFELCFNIVETDDYIIPELLPSQRPAIEMEAYRSSGNLHLHYSYDFMPAGIITRFISRLHYLVRENHYWNNGVELEFSGSTALVVSDSAQKRIRVSVTGTNNTQLMGVIRSHFDHIHETLNMKKEEHVFEEVPCICSQCQKSGSPHFYKYDVLQRLAEKGKEARCDKSLDDIPTDRLLNGFLPPQKPGNLFHSLITTLSQIQGIKKTLHMDENSRNTVVALLLGTHGFRVKDQTLYGSSESGTRLGELDIKIEDETGRAVSIIEAMNLDKYNTTKIDRHVRKLFLNYDCSGLKENYILVYSSYREFVELCRKYREHLEHIDYETYTLLKDGIEEVHTGFNKIAAYHARHRCNKGETILYHIIVDMT